MKVMGLPPSIQFYQYEESYEEMLRELSLSSALDPAWSTPSEKKETMVKFLKTMARLIDCKVCDQCLISWGGISVYTCTPYRCNMCVLTKVQHHF